MPHDWRHLWGLADFGRAFSDGVGNAIYRMSHSVALRVVLVVVLAGGAVLMSWALMPATEYLPAGNQNFIQGILITPTGYNVGEFQSIARRIEGHLRPYWEAEPGSPEAAALDGPVIDQFFFVAAAGFVFMGTSVHPDDAGQAYRVIPIVQAALGGIPGTFAVVQQSSIFDQGPTAGRSIDIDLTGPDLARLLELGGRVFGGVMASVPGRRRSRFPASSSATRKCASFPTVSAPPRWGSPPGRSASPSTP